jgi:hypothetical protein
MADFDPFDDEQEPSVFDQLSQQAGESNRALWKVQEELRALAASQREHQIAVSQRMQSIQHRLEMIVDFTRMSMWALGAVVGLLAVQTFR